MRLKLLLPVIVLMLLISCTTSDEGSCIKMERVGISDRFYYKIIFNTERSLCTKQVENTSDTLGYKIFVMSGKTLQKLEEHIIKGSITSSQLNAVDYESSGCMFTLTKDSSFQEYYILNTDSVSYLTFFEDLNSIIKEGQDSNEMIRLVNSLSEE